MMKFSDEHRKNSWLQQQEAYSKQYLPTCANCWLKYRQRGGCYACSPDGQRVAIKPRADNGGRDDEERGSAGIRHESDAAQTGSWLAVVGIKVSILSDTELVTATTVLFRIRSISSRRRLNQPFFSFTGFSASKRSNLACTTFSFKITISRR